MMQRTIAVAILAYTQVNAVNAQAAAAGRPPKYLCPQDNGLKYTTPAPNEVTFELKCGQGTTAKRIDNTPKNSQKECAQHCSEHPDCQSADYNWQTKNCARFSEYIPTIPMSGVNTWFPTQKRIKVDPQPDPQPAREGSNCPAAPLNIVEHMADAQTFMSDGVTCPGDDGKVFISASGHYMKTRCQHESHSPAPLAEVPMSTLTECFNFCGDTPGCKSVSWEAGNPSWLCRLYVEGEENMKKCSRNYHGAATVEEPPTIEAADDEVVLCSTECPHAHGQTFDTPSGERFRMSCCKRHGVKTIGQDHMPSLKACMSACGTVPACQSVDWHQATGICYFGKHSGEPNINVAGWSSAYSIGCAGACKKEGGCCGSAKGAHDEL
ncbi:pan domain containing protein [Apiospora arundinis]|uniref:Pan domain containing protein n=1 Tax=Apiospora arundinis TaxID=335852 RepID=A0ABR2IRW0_9PEZI